MKFTKEEIMKIIVEELDAIKEQSSSDVPFIDYEEAKDDSEAAILPQLRKANNDQPVFFTTKIRDKEYSSVYTKYKPSIAKAKEYEKMGIQLIWTDGRYGISNHSPKSIISIHRTVSRERDYAGRTGGSYHYGYDFYGEDIERMVQEEIQSMQNEATGKSPMAYLSGDRNNAKLGFTGIGADKIGWDLPLNNFSRKGLSPQKIFDALKELQRKGLRLSDHPELNGIISDAGVTYKGERVSAEDIGQAKVVGG